MARETTNFTIKYETQWDNNRGFKYHRWGWREIAYLKQRGRYRRFQAAKPHGAEVTIDRTFSLTFNLES